MQLFITEYVKENTTITITEDRVVQQLTRVLRAKIGYTFFVQSPVALGKKDHPLVRYTCSISSLQKQSIVAEIMSEEEKEYSPQEKKLCIALPNKFEKMELVVQKCTELGLQHIVFFPSQYSQIKVIADNKTGRLGKIALEAAEQSYGWVLPTIEIAGDISSYLQGNTNIIFDQTGEKINSQSLHLQKGNVNVLVGPEGGRGGDDQKLFSHYEVKKISLGSTVLRTETASIVAAWELVK